MEKNSLQKDFRKIQNEMDSFFSNFFSDNYNLLSTNDTLDNFRTPMTNIKENNKEIITEIEIPGVKKEDIKLNIVDNGLEIKAENKQEDKKEDKDYYRYESSYSGFYKYFPLSDNIDKENIDANYDNGILKIKLPKKQIEQKNIKRIEVK
jgi:HSP20 family protein